MKNKARLDQLVLERGLAPSREKARAFIMAGQILVDDTPMTKPGMMVPADAPVRRRQTTTDYVSRGGDKLAGALDDLSLAIEGAWLDIGQSTGGFTDVLLARGATRVVGVDVGYGQLAERLRQDPRVTSRERTNARTLPADAFGGEAFDGATIDVSFISLRLVLPAIVPHVRAGGVVLALVKPQFEAGREQIGKGGVVADETVITGCVDAVSAAAATLGLAERGRAFSVIRGPKGNQEVFLLFEKPNP